jgi:hypothetical protein
MRWLIYLLLAANLGAFVWGWLQDRPINSPPPPLPTAPGQIRLFHEPPAEPVSEPESEPGSDSVAEPAAQPDDEPAVPESEATPRP